MPATVICPYCGTVISTSCGCSTTCRNPNCKAQISIDSNGNIKNSKPGKTK